MEVMISLFVMAVLFWVFLSYMERYAEKKEKELKKELDEEGEVY